MFAQRSPSNGTRRFTLAALSIMLLLLVAPVFAAAHAQSQVVTATPGYVNLGMAVSMSVTAPASGAYSVVVKEPNGGSAQASLTFTSSGQTLNATFGGASSAFGTTVNQVGTYNVFVEQGTQLVGSTSFYAT